MRALMHVAYPQGGRPESVDRLRKGCELKHGIGINGARLADFANAKAFCEDDLILESHGDSDARDPCRSQLALGKPLQFRCGGLDFVRG
jgi:hypothetical protein